jgi:hypothetical protein
MKKIFAFLLSIYLLPGGLFVFANEPAPEAVNELQTDGSIQNWLVLAPFPNPKTEKTQPPENVTRQGFQIDFLSTLGGETQTEFQMNTTVAYQLPEGISGSAHTHLAHPDEAGLLDFLKMYPEKPNSVAYACCYLNSKTAQPVHFFIGHDDCAKMWLNGQLVHRIWRAEGHGRVKREYYFTGNLQAGANRLLVKVENWGYDWNFQLEAFDTTAVKPVLHAIQQKKALSDFLNCKPRPEGPWDYIISPGTFPKIVWDNPAAAEALGGKISLNVQWYNAQLAAVEQPGNPGRYLGYVTGATQSGHPIRRFVTVFCRDSGWLPWYQTNKVYPDYFENSGFDRPAFNKTKELVAPLLGGFLMEKISQEEPGAVVLSFWQELQPDVPLQTFETPDVIQNDIQVALKRKLLGVNFPPLAQPKTLTQSARTLRPGSAKAAGVTPDAEKKLREVCQEWAENSGEPFNILIARHGVIVLHAAFGPCTVDQKHSVASITKAVAGLMFARFIDQGLIGIDDPVGKYFPDFPVAGSKTMTMRQLFTHTTGLEGHGEWGGLSNAWLDNVIFQNLEKLPVGEVHLYNGMGYDLAGKVMEFVAGKSIQRVIQEQFWLPLGIEGSSLTDLGYSAMLNAEDIAKMGQLLLNQGSYGDRQFFAPSTCEKLMPTNLSLFYPKVNTEWGIGLAYRRTNREPGNANSGYILAKNIIGHGSASSCIFLVDLEHDLVIAQSRRTGGKEYDVYYRKMLETVERVLRN